MSQNTSSSPLALPGTAAAAHREANPARVSGTPPGCVLVVEDDAVSQQVARRHLEAMGYAVVIVNDGAQAVNACMQHEFALVLMDLQMTPMDGFEATREIRRQEREGRRAIPIFGLSATAGGDALARCTAAGMNGLLTKPLQRSHLSQALEQLSATSAQLVPPQAQVNG